MNFFDISLVTANKFYLFAWIASIVGAAVTLIGVLFLMWGTRVRDHDSESQVAELYLAAAKSNERAAEAELKLEQLRKQIAPRFIQEQKFLKSLQGQPKSPVEVLYSKDDPECFNLAQSIHFLLLQAKWDSLSLKPIPPGQKPWKTFEAPDAMMAGAQPSGITVVTKDLTTVHNDADTMNTPFNVLRNAFAEQFGSVHGGGDSNIPEGVLRIIVAPKS